MYHGESVVSLGSDEHRRVTGHGCYSDDLQREGQVFGVFVRSPHAHARIVSIDTGASIAAPGVLRVLTAADLDQAGAGNVSAPPPLAGRGGKPLVVPHRPALAGDRVVHVGQPVALVVAETQAQAEDAVELVVVNYEELEAVSQGVLALAPGAPQIWPEAPGNVAIDWPGPVVDESAEGRLEQSLASAAHRVSFTAVNQRLSGVPLEPRSATAVYDQAGDRYTLFVGSQGAGTLRGQVAGAMRVEPSKLRVITGDVGGSFGLKTPGYPEYPALLVAARLVARPVGWTASRSEAFMSDNQGRDTVSTGELALDRSGRFLALKVDSVTNMGAFLSTNGAHIATNNFARCLPTVYDIPHVGVRVRCVFTNTVPTGPYRGAGRPEANYLMERLIDAAGRETGIDPVELRRINLARPEKMPLSTAVGTTIDSGEFETILDKALDAAKFASFDGRRAEARKRGRLRGIGLACFLEHAGATGTESAGIAVTGNSIVLNLGVQSTGQGHATIFRALLADRLELPAEAITVGQGDSDFELKGGATVASRSTMTAGAAVVKTAEALLLKARRFAGDALEAAETDIEYASGMFAVAGTDRRISLFELAERLSGPDSLDTSETTEVPQSFPNGCHIAEVEIDPETGHVEVMTYVAVDDCGTVLNHALVEGQVVGGIAQGLGQALGEMVVYDPDTGQLITGTLNDYPMPRADGMPPITALEHPVFCRTNPLGVKGVGEAGTTGSIGAIMNAIVNAIPTAEAHELQMPATPEKVWRACRSVREPG